MLFFDYKFNKVYGDDGMDHSIEEIKYKPVFWLEGNDFVELNECQKKALLNLNNMR